jgi:hypothetical protein
MALVQNSLIPYSGNSFDPKLTVCSDGISKPSDARAQALASLGRNRIALARTQIPAALHSRAIIPQAQPQAKVKRIGYVPLQREAREREEDTELMLKRLRLTKSWEEYGSTNGEWRTVATNTRFRLPAGCSLRRSMRLMG